MGALMLSPGPYTSLDVARNCPSVEPTSIMPKMADIKSVFLKMVKLSPGVQHIVSCDDGSPHWHGVGQTIGGRKGWCTCRWLHGLWETWILVVTIGHENFEMLFMIRWKDCRLAGQRARYNGQRCRASAQDSCHSFFSGHVAWYDIWWWGSASSFCCDSLEVLQRIKGRGLKHRGLTVLRQVSLGTITGYVSKFCLFNTLATVSLYLKKCHF